MKFGFSITGIVDVADMAKMNSVMRAIDPSADITITQIKDEPQQPPKQIEDKSTKRPQSVPKLVSSQRTVMKEEEPQKRVYTRNRVEMFATAKLLVAILHTGPCTYKQIEPIFRRANFMPNGAQARMSELIKAKLITKISDDPATFKLTPKGEEYYNEHLKHMKELSEMISGKEVA